MQTNYTFLANYTPSNNPTQIGTGPVAQLGERKFRKLLGSAFETYFNRKKANEIPTKSEIHGDAYMTLSSS